MNFKIIISMIIAGLFYALGFPTILNIQFFLGPVIASAIVFYFLCNSELKKREIFLYLQVFFLSFNLVGYPWLPYTFREFGNLAFPFDYILWLAFSFIILPQYYIFFILKGLFDKHLAIKINKSFHLYCFISIWVMSELLAPQQFATHVGHAWLSISPYLVAAKFGGVTFYSLISAILVFLTLELFNEKKNFNIKLRFPVFILLVISVISHLAFPLKQIGKTEKQLNIRLVQANIGNFLKIDSETGNPISMQKVFSLYEKLSLTPSRLDLDLIIWPETAYPEYQYAKRLYENPESAPYLFQLITQKTGAELFTGGYDFKDPYSMSYFENVWNTGFLFSNEGKLKQHYHKQILIPFGETLPLGPFTEMASKVVKNISYFASGNKLSIFETKKGFKFINPICYEVLVDSFIRDYLNAAIEKPHFILNLTNDSWYGKSKEPYQHKFLAHWRALEHQIPIVRATNTGITSVLYPDGSESEAMPWYTENIMDMQLNLKDSAPTFFQSVGKWGLLIFWLIFIVVVILWHRNLKTFFK